jgi:molecular chaperone GrpE
VSDAPNGPASAEDGDPQEADRPVIRDKRRIDPATGEVRPEAAPPAAPVTDPPGGGSDDAPADVTALEDELAQLVSDDLQRVLDERTADLQRVQAEFTNYRRRVERDRQAVAEQALASVLVGLLPVLDDIDRARSHGELDGGFKLVADGLETTLAKLGLQRYGDAGEPFDPTVHEALTHGHSADVTEPTCSEILQPGYRVGERILRPARVAVLDPAEADD